MKSDDDPATAAAAAADTEASPLSRSSPTSSVSFSEDNNNAAVPLPKREDGAAATASATATNTTTARTDASSSCVQVAVRVRPLLAREGDDENCLQLLPTAHATATIGGGGGDTALQVGGSGGPRFTFDQVFGVKTAQQAVYQARVAPLVVSCLQGYNATILAYGQTGSGVSGCQ